MRKHNDQSPTCYRWSNEAAESIAEYFKTLNKYNESCSSYLPTKAHKVCKERSVSQTKKSNEKVESYLKVTIKVLSMISEPNRSGLVSIEDSQGCV